MEIAEIIPPVLSRQMPNRGSNRRSSIAITQPQRWSVRGLVLCVVLLPLTAAVAYVYTSVHTSVMVGHAYAETVDAGELNRRIDQRLKILASPAPELPITSTVRLTADPGLIQRVEGLYYAALDYRLLSAKALRAARTFVDLGNLSAANDYINRADRYFKFSNSLFSGVTDVADTTISAAQANVIYESALTMLGFAVGYAAPTGYQFLVSRVFDLGTVATDYWRDVAFTTEADATEKAIIKAITKALLAGTGGDKFVQEAVSNVWGQSGVYPLLEKYVRSSEFKQAVLKSFMSIVGNVGQKEAKKIVDNYLAQNMLDILHMRWTPAVGSASHTSADTIPAQSGATEKSPPAGKGKEPSLGSSEPLAGTVPPSTISSSPTVSFLAIPNQIKYLESSTLVWNAQYVKSCKISGGTWGTFGSYGFLTVFPKKTTTYAVTCVGPGGSASQLVTVSVSR